MSPAFARASPKPASWVSSTDLSRSRVTRAAEAAASTIRSRRFACWWKREDGEEDDETRKQR